MRIEASIKVRDSIPHPNMKPEPMETDLKKVNWFPLPDPIQENEVNLTLQWSADERTSQAIKRQAKLICFKTPNDYLCQALAAVIAGNEEATVVTDEGELACA
jgi:hypothetical protein